jgi:hypothetical protein
MEAHMTMKRVEVEFAETGNEIFVVVDGLRIAKRGRPGTPHAKTWVLLEPDWTVRGVWEDGEYAIEIEQQRCADSLMAIVGYARVSGTGQDLAVSSEWFLAAWTEAAASR